jgi:hypothetical protein
MAGENVVGSVRVLAQEADEPEPEVARMIDAPVLWRAPFHERIQRWAKPVSSLFCIAFTAQTIRFLEILLSTMNHPELALTA